MILYKYFTWDTLYCRSKVGIYFLKSKTKTVPSLAEAPTLKKMLKLCPFIYIGILYLVTPTVPADLEDSSSSLVAVNELAALSAPDVNTFVKTPAGQKLSVRRKCDTVDGLLVPG